MTCLRIQFIHMHTTCHLYSFVYECSNPHFLGWMTLSSNKEFEKSSYHYRYLINMKQKSDIICKKVFTTISIHNDILHYMEARLVNELESMGIGRPSTFASIVETIQHKKQKNHNVFNYANFRIIIKRAINKLF